MDISTLQRLLELGWPALITVAFGVLARAYMAQVSGEIAYLRARVDVLEGELREVKKTIAIVK